MKRYKLIYNRKGKWYPGESVVTQTFGSREAAKRKKESLSYDKDIKKAEIIEYTPKKKKKKSSNLIFDIKDGFF